MCKFLVSFLTFFSIVTLVSPVSAQTKTVVIPMFSDGAPTEKKVFVTDTTFNGNLGGVSGADDKCQSAADNAVPPLSGIYKAWVSRSNLNSIPTRPSFQKHDLPYKNLDGSLIATSFDDFLDGVFAGVIKRLSGSEEPRPVWTGTFDSGSVSAFNCLGWTSDDGGDSGTSGASNGGVTSENWSDQASGFCNLFANLYCFEQ